MQAREKDNRRDWFIIFAIILLGLLCILLAGSWAVRLTPSWSLDSNMESKIDPNSQFLTERPNGFIAPINSSILTQPVWYEVFLTPGASFKTGTPPPTKVNTQPPPPATQTKAPTLPPTVTPTPGIIIPTSTANSNPPTPSRTPIPTTPSADLRITLNDGSTTYIVGGTQTYTIVVYNSVGPSAVTGATVVDNFPAALSGITWTCAATGGATCTANGTGNINDTVNLPVGATVTYTVTANVSPTATGNLVNTATVTAPGGITDPVPANNSATDINTPAFNVNLQITKTDGVPSYTPGGTVIYTIVASNAGPAHATGARVTDTFPQASSVSWTCTATGGASCPANGTGNIDQTVNIPVGGTVTYIATVNILPSATGNLVNTAAVTAPAGYNETAPGNNSATDTDTLASSADLSITKTDNATDYTVTSTRTYVIVVSNAGPSNVTGATVIDNFPAQVSVVSWSCIGTGGATCTAIGGGSINDTVDIPVGGTVTYTATASFFPTATGNLVNTATVTGPAGLIDPPGNNSATDTDIPYIDLAITKDDGSATYLPGGSVTYAITVTNNSAFSLNGITVSDAIPSLVTTWGWCVAPCVPAANTTANLGDTINLAAGGSISYNILANINVNAAGNLVNTATVTAPAGYTDAVPGNNSATDTDVNQSGEPDIGPPDGGIYPIGDGGSVSFFLSQPIVANGDAAADFVFYELAIGTNIYLDQVIIEISQDNVNWYRVFFWGDPTADTNTNVSLTLPNISGFCATEVDNCVIPVTELYNGGPGITIDVDNSPLSAVPLGNYYWIRFTEPGLTPGDGTHVDSILILP